MSQTISLLMLSMRTGLPQSRLFKLGRVALVGLSSLSLGGVGIAQADTLQIAPVRDNTLYERPTGDVSNGAGIGLFIGQTGVNAGNVLRRALLSFDLNGQIPVGSVINGVSLTINVNTVPPGATGFDATLHQVSASWGEAGSSGAGTGGSGAPAQTGDATWLHRFFNTDLWATPGGDFNPTPSATTAIGAGVGSYIFTSTPEMVADVQDWVDTPANNFGWIILGEEANAQNARRFGSRESGAGNEPILFVDFTPPVIQPPLPAVAVPTLNSIGLLTLMFSVLCLSLLRLRRRKRS